MFWRKNRLPYTLSRPLQLKTKLKDMSFIVFDTETTGFAIETHDRLIEIGAVVVEQLNVTNQTFQTLINPSREIPAHISELTSIEQHHIASAPPPLEAIQQYFKFVEASGSNGWVGHRLQFDMTILKKELQREKFVYDLPSTVDTFELIDYLLPNMPNLDLEGYANCFQTPIFERHRALGDALTTAHLFVELIQRLEENGIKTFADLLRIKHNHLISL